MSRTRTGAAAGVVHDVWPQSGPSYTALRMAYHANSPRQFDVSIGSVTASPGVHARAPGGPGPRPALSASGVADMLHSPGLISVSVFSAPSKSSM